MPPPTPARRQRILITGASSGIGAELARRWAQQGRDLALCARRAAELNRLRTELVTIAPQVTVTVHPVDVTDAEAFTVAFGSAVAAHGGLDRVVANAGAARGGPVGAGHAEDNRATALTNFVGVLNQAETAVEHFRTVGSGHLVIMSSMSSLRGMGGRMTVYAATKAGVASLAEGLRSELWDSGIRVTSVHPGYIDTEMIASFPRRRFTANLQRGADAIVTAIEQERPRAYVPALPWVPMSLPMRALPLGLYRRIAG